MAASSRSPPPLSALNSITVAGPGPQSPSPPSSIPVKRPLESSTPSVPPTTTTAPTSNSFQSSSSSSSSSSVSSSTVPSSAATTPPTKKVLERNQACLSCRSRKRKCDGGKPTCGACERLERRCVYSSGGLSTVTKIHSSSSFHAQKSNNNNTSTPSSRWAPPPSNLSPEDAHALPIHGPPPRTAQTPSPSVLTTPTATNPQTTFTPINQGSTSPTATTSISNQHNGRSSYEPPSKRQAITEPTFDASLFTAQFLQASPFVGLDAGDYSTWSDIGLSGGYPDAYSKKGDSPLLAATPESTLPYGDTEDLPPPETLVELVTLFFDQIHPFLPCLYRKQVLADIAPGGTLSKSCPLTYSMLALAAYIHPSASLQSRAAHWHTAAKRGFDTAVTRGQYSLHNVQASIYICLHSFVTSEMSELWVFLAKAYRMCNPLGLHQIDSPRRNRFMGFLPPPKSEQDLEERRRASWGVYVLNSLLSYSTGWPLVINDRDFCVNFPVDEEVFQSGEIEKMSHIVVEPFAHTLEDLITPVSPSTPVRGPYHYICKLSVLLSRIASHNNSPLPPSAAEFESLETTLARFRLSLPRKYRSIVGLDPRDVTHVTQLNLLLHVCTILLHHPATVPPQEGDVTSTAFTSCVSAVGNILALLKTSINTAGEEGDALQNPFITGALFLAAKVLMVRWVEGGRERSVRAEIELVLGVFGRVRERWPELAGKYRDLVGGELGRGGGGCLEGCARKYVGEMGG